MVVRKLGAPPVKDLYHFVFIFGEATETSLPFIRAESITPCNCYQPEKKHHFCLQVTDEELQEWYSDIRLLNLFFSDAPECLLRKFFREQLVEEELIYYPITCQFSGNHIHLVCEPIK